jgi:hypothetical protein
MDWSISSLECRVQEGDLSDVVYLVHWRCSGTEDTYSGTVYSTCTLPAADPAFFTPYANLTQEQVLGWIWANGVNQAATEAAVAQQIEMQKNPPTIQPPLPWVTP